MNRLVVWWIIFAIGCLSGIYCLIAAARRPKNDPIRFRWKHLFKNVTFAKTSRVQLAMEGLLLILASLFVIVTRDPRLSRWVGFSDERARECRRQHTVPRPPPQTSNNAATQSGEPVDGSDCAKQ